MDRVAGLARLVRIRLAEPGGPSAQHAVGEYLGGADTEPFTAAAPTQAHGLGLRQMGVIHQLVSPQENPLLLQLPVDPQHRIYIPQIPEIIRVHSRQPQ
ncbi:hypothetical protein D3C76_1281790 [compost metagenome]